MSLIVLDNIIQIIADLNRELNYKINSNLKGGIESEYNFIILASDGDDHTIQFLGEILWSSELEKQMEDIKPEQELRLNERKYFEPHLRRLINQKINMFQDIQL